MKIVKKIENEKIYLHLFEKEKIIGECIVFKNIIEYLNIEKEYRHISNGRKLLNSAIEEISKNGFEAAIIGEYNDASFNFFKKQGFILKDNVLFLDGFAESRKQKTAILNASVVSFILNFILAFGKILLGFTFSLSSLIADGINSSFDCITNFLVVIGVKIAHSPEDEAHPFGHGKIEAIFSLIIGAIILISTSSVLFENVQKLIKFENSSVTSNPYILYFFSASFIMLKIVQFFYVRYIVIKYKSIILKAVLKDYLSDILISSSVLIGIFLTIKLNRIFDILLAISITLYIIYQALGILYENTLILLDTQNKELLNEIKKCIIKFEDIHFVHDLFMISSGKDIYIFADIRVDKNLNVEKSHELSENVSLKIREEFPSVKRVSFHVEPIY